MPPATLWSRGNLVGSTVVSGAPSYSKANECKRLKTINKYTGHPPYVMSSSERASQCPTAGGWRWRIRMEEFGPPTFRQRNKRPKEFCSPWDLLDEYLETLLLTTRGPHSERLLVDNNTLLTYKCHRRGCMNWCL